MEGNSKKEIAMQLTHTIPHTQKCVDYSRLVFCACVLEGRTPKWGKTVEEEGNIKLALTMVFTPIVLPLY